MRDNVALFTKRYNIKSTLSGIAFVVMVIRCFLIARAKEGCWVRHFACFDGDMNSISGLFSFRILFDVSCQGELA